MQEIFIFATSVILISVSGVMSPGPLFAANVAYGIKQSTKSGINMAHGHALVELPLVTMLGFGIVSLEIIPNFTKIVSIFGGVALFLFAGFQIKNLMKQQKLQTFQPKHGAFVSGIFLSVLNPFFIMWWLTVGFKLISDSLEIWAFAGIFIMFGLHIWLDYVWMGSIAYFASKVNRLVSNKNYRIIILILSGILVYFGVIYISEGFSIHNL